MHALPFPGSKWQHSPEGHAQSGRCSTAYSSEDQEHPPAACTWATEALARGVVSTNEKTDSRERPPSSLAIVARMTSQGTGSVRSRHFSNSRTYSGGNRVGELAMNCPSLM